MNDMKLHQVRNEARRIFEGATRIRTHSISFVSDRGYGDRIHLLEADCYEGYEPEIQEFAKRNNLTVEVRKTRASLFVVAKTGGTQP